MSSLLTVIIPVYNVERFLVETLDSVFDQNFKDFSVIAVNDGSTDNSPDILEKYSAEKNFQIIHQNNRGLSSARNTGLQKANGKFVYFLDSDDKINPELFSSVLFQMEKYSAEIATFSGECISEDGKLANCSGKYKKPNIPYPLAGQELFETMLSKDHYSPVISTYIYQREFLKKNNLLFSDGYLHEDEAFSIKALGLAKSALSVSEVFYYHRVRSGSIMDSPKGKNNCIGWLQAASEILNFLDIANLQDSARKSMETRAVQLIHNAIKIVHLQNDSSLKEEVRSRYFKNKKFREVGGRISLHLNYPFLYKAISRLSQ